MNDFSSHSRPSDTILSGPTTVTAAMDASLDGNSEEYAVSLLNNEGVSLLQQNERAEAANVFLQALWQVEAKTGGNDPTMNEQSRPSTTLNNMINSSGERAKPSCYIFQREDYDEGLQVYKEGIPMPPTLCLEEQLVILRYNMGQVYICYKQYHQARRWFQTAWMLLQTQRRQQLQDSSSKTTDLSLPLLHNLAYCNYCLGENNPALKYYQDALALVEPHSLERAATCNCIAVLLFHKSSAKQNDTGEALELLKESLAIYQRIYGPESQHVATCYGNMGRIHFLTTAHELALKAFQKAYGIRKNLFGNESMDTAAMLFNLGQSLHYRGALDQALEAYRKFLRVARAHHKSNPHRDICAVQRAMAQVHRQKGQLQEACAILRHAYQAGCGALGPHETEVSCILSELGSLYAETNDYPNAIHCFLHFLQTQEKLHEPTHKNILITKINLARVYKHSSDYMSAFHYYKEVHALQVQLAAQNAGSSLEVASTLSSMGLMLYLLQAYRPALDCYQEALRVRLEKLGTSQHADVAETINSIGLVLFKLGLLDMAKEAFQECIQLRTKLMHSEDDNNIQAVQQASHSSKEIAVLLFNMATACLQNGEDEQGMEWYKESLRVERQVLGESHPDVSMTLQHIARVHEERGDFEEAISHHRQALEIARKCVKDNNWEQVVRLLRMIGNLHFMQGQVKEAMIALAEATRLQTSSFTAEHLQRSRLEGISVSGANFYGFSKLHPPCSPAA